MKVLPFQGYLEERSKSGPHAGRGLACALLVLAMLSPSLGSAAEGAEMPVAKGAVFIAAAEGVSVFDRDGAMRFGNFVTSLEADRPGPLAWDDMIYDGWQLPSGNYLCSSHRYVREIAPDGTVLWEYRLEAPSELKTCVPLPNGDVMTVDAEGMALVQISDQGRTEVRRIPVPTNQDASTHERYNLLRRTDAGTFLLALRSEKAFIEVDDSGQEIWRHPVPDLPIVAERLPDGNTLLSWRGGLIEVTPDHEVVWEFKAEELTEFPVLIVAGFHRFENGNTLIANSDWHYGAPGENRVQLFEINRDKEVVWTLGTDAFAGKKPGSLEPKTDNVEHRIIGIQWLGDGDAGTNGPDGADFFAARVQPILEENCFKCHSHAHKIKGGLALDSRSGITAGGEGGPILVPGKPEESRLVTAVQHVDKEFQMPPKAKLNDAEIATLVDWIKAGAVDTRPLTEAKAVLDDDGWEAIYAERKGWWSLQPVASVTPPESTESSWPRNGVDAFILASLTASDLAPVSEAEPRALVRRLSYALTGLPPTPDEVANYAANPTDAAYEALVQHYLDSPHFGERWARHWMDVVHYSDTHGYEWDAPAKNAWRYRDYLIRAYNNDISYKQLVLEQIAGDLVSPRVDPETGLNEAMIGPMSMRMGERRHGDNAAAEGVTQEAIANMIDTVSKGFIATTVACAQCHDHKLDAVAQRDYYSLAGVLMSSRWTVRSAESQDPNGPVLEELSATKSEMKQALGNFWSDARSVVESHIATPPPVAEKDEKKAAKKDSDTPEELPFPENVMALRDYVLQRVESGESVEAAWTALAARYREERSVRLANNQKNLTLTADFTEPGVPDGWRTDGWGMKHGQVDHGALVVADEGDALVAQLLPAGRWSHVWSKRLAGALRSELLPQDPPPTVSVAYAGGDYAAQSVVVDNAFHSERMQFLKQPMPGWLTFSAGNHAALAGGPDTTPRLVYLEMVTKSLNNYYPPRDNYGGLKQAVEEDPRSWFGATHAYDVTPGYTPVDELGHLESLFALSSPPTTLAEATARMTASVMAAVEHWRVGTCDEEDVRLINEALVAGWLPNTAAEHPALAALVTRYRETEARLQPERTVGSADDWYDGEDAQIGIRGSYTALGEEVPRGTIRFLDAPGLEGVSTGSGRLELAQNIARADNPLTARVYVNRIWHHLFGAGIVRTVDDFGHLGERPSHPELLDWLAHRFVEEGWSTKKLIALLVQSATWRQRSVPAAAGVTADPENRLWHHMPLRRLEAEAIRDAMLAASGHLEPTLFGPPINPYRVAEDSTKRLYAGPLDGLGRRSIYQKMTLMELPRFLALFNQPIPMLTTGRRDTTNVPNQALAMLNDPFVMAMAAKWSGEVIASEDETVATRVSGMFRTAFARPPSPEETARFVDFATQCAELRGVPTDALLSSQPVWQDVAHAIFNLKEFIYVQ